MRAGDRAQSLGAAGEALRYFERAAELTDGASERADLLDRAAGSGGTRPSGPLQSDCSARPSPCTRPRGISARPHAFPAVSR